MTDFGEPPRVDFECQDCFSDLSYPAGYVPEECDHCQSKNIVRKILHRGGPLPPPQPKNSALVDKFGFDIDNPNPDNLPMLYEDPDGSDRKEVAIRHIGQPASLDDGLRFFLTWWTQFLGGVLIAVTIVISIVRMIIE